MTVLHRTDLTTSQKIECAAAAVAGQHKHGSKTALSERYEISRPTVYAVGATGEAVLRTHFEAPLLGGAGVTVRIDDAQLRRAVVALRVVAPNAIRPIEDLLSVLYPGVKVSYGTIQAMLVEAEGRAARFNAHSALDGVQAGALDEMFSQGEPVLAGVDLDTGYLFGLSLSPTRDAGAWAQVLRAGQGQGLSLEVVVKDAARGIAAGVAEVFPDAEQRDDCFHVLYEMHKVRRKLERRAYAAIEREGEALGRLGKIRARDKTCRRKAKCALGKARRQCTEAIERFDAFEVAMGTVRGALECVDVVSGELHRPEQVEAWIAQAAERIDSLATGETAAHSTNILIQSHILAGVKGSDCFRYLIDGKTLSAFGTRIGAGDLRAPPSRKLIRRMRSWRQRLGMRSGTTPRRHTRAAICSRSGAHRWNPVELPRLCGGADPHAACGHGGGACACGQEQGRGRLRPERSVREAARADGVLVGRHDRSDQRPVPEARKSPGRRLRACVRSPA